MKEKEQNPWKKLSSKVIYQNDWITLREDAVITPDGSQGIYSVVHPRIATGIVALTPQKEIYLVGQYRYPVEVYSWEIIEGGVDTGEDVLAGAKRELLEEAGVSAASWRQLGGVIHLSNCHSSEVAYLYVAEDLAVGVAKPDATEILQTKVIPFEEALRMVMVGEITDGLSIIAILRLAQELQMGFEK